MSRFGAIYDSPNISQISNSTLQKVSSVLSTSSLADMSINTATLNAGNVLAWNGSKWTNQTVAQVTGQSIATVDSNGHILSSEVPTNVCTSINGNAISGNTITLSLESLSDTNVSLANNIMLQYSTSNSKWNSISGLSTKGDLLAFSTATNRLPVGSDGMVLSADSSQALGLNWKTLSNLLNINSQCVGTGDTQTLTNKTIDSTTNTVTCDKIRFTGGTLTVSGAPTPAFNSILTVGNNWSAYWDNLPNLISNTTDIDNLMNVSITSVADKQLLQYSSSASKWENVSAITNTTASYLQYDGGVINITNANQPGLNEVLCVGSGYTGYWNTITNLAGISSSFVGTTDTQTLTNKTLTSSTNTIASNNLLSATSIINIGSASAPTNGQVLTASSSTSASWVTPTNNSSSNLNIVTITYVVQSDYVSNNFTPSNIMNFNNVINIYVCDLNLTSSVNYFNLPTNLTNGQSIIVHLNGTISSHYITFKDSSNNAIFTSSGDGAIFQTINSSNIYQFTYYTTGNNPWYVSGFNPNSWTMVTMYTIYIQILVNYVAIYSKSTSASVQTSITLPYSMMSNGDQIIVKDVSNYLSNTGCNLYIINASSGIFGPVTTAGVTMKYVYMNNSLVSV
jgi:hypothetical protein